MGEKEFLLKYQSLPEVLKEEVSDFIEFLFQKVEVNKEKRNKESQKPPVREAGTMKSLIASMTDDFDAPLEDFKGYM